MASHSEADDEPQPTSGGVERRVPDLSTRFDIDPVSAIAVENADFGVADLADRNVSYVMLCEAGVDPFAADRLRRRFSLVWTFSWTYGAHLLQRAEQLRTLREAERSWISASAPADRKHSHRAQQRWASIREAAERGTTAETAETAESGESAGSVTPSADRCQRPLAPEKRPSDESWTEAVTRFLAEQ